MKTNEHVLEVAIFTVKQEFVEAMPEIRTGLRKALKGFAGLLELNTYSPIDSNRTFADMAKWDTLENALAAARSSS